MDGQVRVAAQRDRDLAVQVWWTANAARGLDPSSDRIRRVEEKVAEPGALLLVAAVGGPVVGMALLEPARDANGTGEVITGAAHGSMVLIAPAWWGQGIGTPLVTAAHQHAEHRGWTTTSLWTRSTNARAQHLYKATGYRPTGHRNALPSGDEIIRPSRP